MVTVAVRELISVCACVHVCPSTPELCGVAGSHVLGLSDLLREVRYFEWLRSLVMTELQHCRTD
eukprot:COSAG01_NODE_583_length_15194_cov_5.640808_12_plen_64_part_00